MLRGLFVTVVMFLAGCAGDAIRSVDDQAIPAGTAPEDFAASRAQAWLDEVVTLDLDGTLVQRSRGALGARVDVQALRADVRRAAAEDDAMARVWTQLTTWGRGARLTIARTVDLDAARAALAEVASAVDRPAVEPELDSMGEVTRVPEAGRQVDVESALPLVEGDLLASALRIVVPVTRLEPTRSLAVARRPEPAVLGTFSTRFRQRGDEGPRAYNVRRAARSLDGVVIAAGGVLSFNDVVGERSEARGYRIAHVIFDGEMIDGVGGGVCQVASTLHAAAFLAGFPIRRHVPHSRPSSYIPMGLDATVVWPDVDLVVENPLTVPVTVRTRVERGELTIELWGRARPRVVSWERAVLGRTDFAERVIEDPTVPVGEDRVTQDGGPGFIVRRVRVIEGVTGPLRESTRFEYPPTDRIVRRNPSAASVEADSVEVAAPDDPAPAPIPPAA